MSAEFPDSAVPSDLLERFNPGPDAPLRHGTVIDWISRGVEQQGDAAAVCFYDEALSYSELHAISNRVAHCLRDKGVRPGDRVGLSLDRSVESIACLVGILKAGAAYVPLDPDYPLERLSIMRADADVSLLLTHRRHRDRFDGDGGRVVLWEDLAPRLTEASGAVPESLPEPEDVAYIIFTSGSTGRPKGIEMPHRALANLIEWQLERDGFKPGARVLQYSSISFDVSFQEIATTLASGGQLFMVRDEDRRDPRVLLRRIEEFEIERLYLPFVALRSLVETALNSGVFPQRLTEVVTAGEQLRVDDGVREFFSKIPGSVLDNQYGPSESHVITAHLLEGDPRQWPDLPPIGRPLKNNSVYILDEAMRPVAPGEIGELYLAGRNLARGYFRRKDLTGAAFIPSPFKLAGRSVLYRTGDLGNHDEDGRIHYRGRTDHQVKIRGNRVEPGEVNAAVARFTGVAQCLTHAFRNASGNAYLVTYVTSSPGTSVDPASLREFLRERLPDYMVPAFVLPIGQIVYAPSGKVDLKSLPDPATAAQAGPSDYRNETEARLGAIWTEVLGFPNIPREANFFDLGGDSLRAVSLFIRIAEEFGRELPLAILSQAPTIAKFAEHLEGESSGSGLSGYRCLEMIQEGEAGVAPLFLVHGGAGNVLLFKDLAQHLDPAQPVYAFQWAGWDGGRGHRSIPVMAAAYRKELLRFMGAGPIRLGGHCIGGLVAIELARQMQGDPVEIIGPLLVTDSPHLRAGSYRRGDPEASPESREAFERMKDDLLAQVPVELRTGNWRGEAPEVTRQDGRRSTGLTALLKRVPPLFRLLLRGREWLRQGRIQWTLLRGRKIPISEREYYCQSTLIGAARRYSGRPYPGDLIYFRTATFAGRQIALSGWWEDRFMGFAELCEGNFEGHVVGGLHNDLFALPYTASAVRAAFARTASPAMEK